MIILKILGWILLVLLGLLCAFILLLFIALLIPAQVRLRYENKKFFVNLKILFFKKQLYPAVPKPKSKRQGAAADKKIKKTAKKQQNTKKTTEKSSASASNNGGKASAAAEITTGAGRKSTYKKAVKPANERIMPDDKRITVKAEASGDKKAIEADINADTPSGSIISNELVKIGIEDISDIIYAAAGLIKKVLKSLKFKDIEIVLPVYDKDPAKCAIKYGKVNAFLYTAVAKIENTLRLYFKRVDIYPDFADKRAGEEAAAVTVQGTLMGILTAVLWAARSLMKDKILFPNGIHLFKKSKNGGKNK